MQQLSFQLLLLSFLSPKSRTHFFKSHTEFRLSICHLYHCKLRCARKEILTGVATVAEGAILSRQNMFWGLITTLRQSSTNCCDVLHLKNTIYRKIIPPYLLAETIHIGASINHDNMIQDMNCLLYNCVHLDPMFPFLCPCACSAHTVARSVIYCLRESLIHLAFKLSHNTPVRYDLLYFKCHPFCLSRTDYTTKYNPEQLLSAGHPLNISLSFNKDWTSSSFVTVTSHGCWSAHYCRETEM